LNELDLAWNLFVELRKEIVETQKIRAQVIGFKITFTSTAIGIIIAGSARWPIELLVLPAFAAVFFDTLIASYGVGIKRMGFYCHRILEPVLRKITAPSDCFLLWHEFRRTQNVKREFLLHWQRRDYHSGSARDRGSGVIPVAEMVHWATHPIALVDCLRLLDHATALHTPRRY